MIKFKYTKANGEVSERVAIVVKSPEPNYLMLDVSDLDEEDKAIIEFQYIEMQEKINAIRSKYYFDHLFKNFKPAGISDKEPYNPKE